jgi:hypothetical protein
MLLAWSNDRPSNTRELRALAKMDALYKQKAKIKSLTKHNIGNIQTVVASNFVWLHSPYIC